MLQPMLSRLLDEEQFLSPFGVRSVSKIHATHRDLGVIPGVGMAMIEYVPGESNSALFGGNSNWRGPIWLPVNYMLIQAVEKFHRFLGNEFMFAVPCLGAGVAGFFRPNPIAFLGWHVPLAPDGAGYYSTIPLSPW